MQRRPVPESLLDYIRDHHRFYILGHIEPDGDCIGSQVGLARFLARIGKEPHLVSPGPFQRTEIRHFAQEFSEHIPPEDSEPRGAETGDEAVIIVDCSTLDRIGHLAGELRSLPVAVIDHHSSGEAFGDLRFVDPSVAATTLMIQALIERYGELPSPDEAQMLFFGLATDTGFFRFLGRESEDVFGAASRLVDAGASPRDVSAMISSGRTFASRRLIGRLLNRAEAYAGGAFIMTHMTAEEREEFSKENRDSDALYGLLLAIEGCEVIALIREEPGLCKGSLRATGEVDVGEIASLLGGGGHQKAAGFLLHAGVEETMARVREEVEKRLPDPPA